MKYFTSDWHLGDDRLGINGKPNLFYRPFKSVNEQNHTIFENFIYSGFQDGDELWHLGDVGLNESDINYWMKIIKDTFPNSKFNLVVGNYDEDKLDVLGKYFDYIEHESVISIGNETQYDEFESVYLNHYPINCKNALYRDVISVKPIKFAITGHIHGLWKVQPKMINVGVDAWHFKPVSEDEILFCWNAMQNFYDENVFPYDNKIS